jgi:hypothetical protein
MSNASNGGNPTPERSSYEQYRRDYDAYLSDYYGRYIPQLTAYKAALRAQEQRRHRRFFVAISAAAIALLGAVSRYVDERNDETSLKSDNSTSVLQPTLDVGMTALNSYWDEQSNRLVGSPMSDPDLTSKSTMDCLGEPFAAAYCPQDNKLYINFGEISEAGEYIRGYDPNVSDDELLDMVLAHEYGHHVVNRLNILPYGSPDGERLADCLAGSAIGSTRSIDRETLGSIAYLTGDYDPLTDHATPSFREYDALLGYDFGVDSCLGIFT